jgi:hypothetical protein
MAKTGFQAGMTPGLKQPMRSVSMLDPGFAAMEKRLAGGASRGNKAMKMPIKKGRQRMDFSKGTSLARTRKEV